MIFVTSGDRVAMMRLVQVSGPGRLALPDHLQLKGNLQLKKEMDTLAVTLSAELR